MKELIGRYKEKKAKLLSKRNSYELIKGMMGACISMTGEIQAYNAVLSDLAKLVNNQNDHIECECCGKDITHNSHLCIKCSKQY